MADHLAVIDAGLPEPNRLESCDQMVRGGSRPHYAIGENLMLWSIRPGLCGLVLWGHMSVAQVCVLERVFDSCAHRWGATRSDFILDVRHLHGLDSDLYDDLVRAVTRRLPVIGRRVGRHAVLHSASLVGSVVSGFYVTLGTDLEWRAFTELAPALAWLDVPQLVDTAALLDRLVLDAMAGATLLDRLRNVLAGARGSSTSLGDVSRLLGVSERSLQRELRGRGTTFRDEVYRARMDLGKKLLLQTDHKIAEISGRLGFSNEANFITFFRRATGESPGAWRRGNRHHAGFLFTGSRAE